MYYGFAAGVDSKLKASKIMRIKINEIPEQGLELNLDIPAGSIDVSDIDEGFLGDVRFAGNISVSRRRFTVSGKMNGLWNLRCARCLKKITSPVKSTFQVFLTPSIPPDENRIRGLKDDDMDESVLIGNEIDMNQILREQMILHLPMKPICSTSCRGLCPHCGKDLNLGSCGCDATPADPRLAKLKEFLDRKGE
ncbi:DUF177 domain-containing protein [bacterium]|nr:DUF177 domain-containing protein [candidate division CSSED10-310 bacterium]